MTLHMCSRAARDIVIDRLWEQLRDTIDRAYADGVSDLRDFARNVSWTDRLEALLAREEQHERNHRKGRPESMAGQGWRLSTARAAKCILLRCLVFSDTRDESGNWIYQIKNLPLATGALQLRDTCFEAEVLAFLIRDHVSTTFVQQCGSLDYAELMTGTRS